MTDCFSDYPNKLSKRLFFLLWLFCLVGSWSVFPYLYYSKILPSSVSILNLFLLSTVQTALFFGLACLLSYKILPKTDLQPFVVNNFFNQIILPGVISGICVGLIIYSLDKIVFPNSFLSKVRPPYWAGALASIYGAVNEEVLLRLFLFTTLYFIFKKVCRIAVNAPLWPLWIVNIIVALIFGLGHLPAAMKLTNLSSFEIFRILFLNGIPGIIFGWLYWTRGLWSSMTAHFVTDLMIHVFLI